ncbi:hypothetical protein C8R47DRAFT_1084976 [Mycena vitilis]|nr:hypothetical protein C8R47DRAFT_1084976 [Mycena vitilis]
MKSSTTKRHMIPMADALVEPTFHSSQHRPVNVLAAGWEGTTIVQTPYLQLRGNVAHSETADFCKRAEIATAHAENTRNVLDHTRGIVFHIGSATVAILGAYVSVYTHRLPCVK